ncbi:hypothetical protein ALC53_06386 [Atta colombica]|uniref:Uncharacterized protein n=1 Tax=Atta colombica TaxID=520822 RepID=A0A195BG26_9HYME|nr:hypothetical protein ALC53_06386 [Atta colombica]
MAGMLLSSGVWCFLVRLPMIHLAHEPSRIVVVFSGYVFAAGALTLPASCILYREHNVTSSRRTLLPFIPYLIFENNNNEMMLTNDMNVKWNAPKIRRACQGRHLFRLSPTKCALHCVRSYVSYIRHTASQQRRQCIVALPIVVPRPMPNDALRVAKAKRLKDIGSLPLLDRFLTDINRGPFVRIDGMGMMTGRRSSSTTGLCKVATLLDRMHLKSSNTSVNDVELNSFEPKLLRNYTLALSAALDRRG